MTRPTGRQPTTTVAISLKMYFSHARTLAYCAALADLARADADVRSGATALVVLPTFVALRPALDAAAGSRVAIGAQDLAAADEGPFTGEVSGRELAEIGCRYVEVGHAERRTLYGEDHAVVAAKTSAAMRNGLVPLLCVGEPERSDPAAAVRHCAAEVRSALADAAGQNFRLLVAYEPYWAIGQPAPAPVDYVVDVCAGLRWALGGDLDDFGILYGGSAGPGLLTALGTSVDGLFLGRFAHDPAAVGQVLAEAGRATTATSSPAG